MSGSAAQSAELPPHRGAVHAVAGCGPLAAVCRGSRWNEKVGFVWNFMIYQPELVLSSTSYIPVIKLGSRWFEKLILFWQTCGVVTILSPLPAAPSYLCALPREQELWAEQHDVKQSSNLHQPGAAAAGWSVDECIYASWGHIACHPACRADDHVGTQHLRRWLPRTVRQVARAARLDRYRQGRQHRHRQCRLRPSHWWAEIHRF